MVEDKMYRKLSIFWLTLILLTAFALEGQAGFSLPGFGSKKEAVQNEKSPEDAPPSASKLTNRQKAAVIETYEEYISEATPLQVGDPLDDVLVRLGEPEGVMTIGSKKRLSYGEGYVVVTADKVAGIENIPLERLAAPDWEAYEDYQEAQGKVRYMGKWMTEEESEAAYAKVVTARERKQERVKMGKTQKATREHKIAMQTARLVDFKQGGKRINKQELIVPGKITVIDFYADWCGPCKTIAPYLETFAQDPQVAVRKVDMVSWRSPVAKQWNLRSIPNMRVYDSRGNQIGKPTSSLQEVYQYIQQAKRSF